MSIVPGRRGAVAFFVTFGICLIALAVALNVGWIVLTWQEVVPLLIGVLIFAAIITGLILNTTFLVREIHRNEQHDAFLNAVTHELKTPVTSIRLHLETLMAREPALDAATRQGFYGTMIEDCDRLLHTIEQVLRTGQTGRRPPHRERLDLRALVTECVRLTRTRLHLPDEAIRIAPPPAGEPRADVLADAGEITSAVINLVDNAVKYSGDRVDVSIAIERAGEHWVLRVHDRGIGLPPVEVKRIFKRFYRIPGPLAQRVKGTGLGLFIVQHAARRHGGRVWATSEGPGRGSTFHFELPAAEPA